MLEAIDTTQIEDNIRRQNTDYPTYNIYYHLFSEFLHLALLRLVSVTILVHLQESSKCTNVHKICGNLCEKDEFSYWCL